jgi:4-amino-4-deoxychorismate lyase
LNQSPTLPLLLETIKLKDGLISNLSYHQERCNKSREALYSSQNTLDLKNIIHPPKKGLYRCRILYAEEVLSVEYIPYYSKPLRHIKIVSSSLDYSFKYANREALSSLLEKHSGIDEILIVKNGFITDTSIANIAFFTQGQWYTPTTPLLEGTQRQKLLDEGFLQVRDIKIKELNHYTQVALMNAMIGFCILTNIHIQDLEGNTYDY